MYHAGYETRRNANLAGMTLARRTLLTGAMAAAALPAAARPQDGTQLTIGTGTSGRVYYPLGGSMADILSRTIPVRSRSRAGRPATCNCWAPAG